jgi:protein phosphatase
MVLVDAWALAPVPGDRYLLCTDGLFNELDPSRIQTILREVEDPTEAAEELVRAAVKAGGRDNVTVLVVDVTVAEPVADPPPDRVVGTYKAVPDSVLRLDPAADIHHGPSDPHPDEIEVDRSSGGRRLVTWRLGLFVCAVLLVLAILLVSLVAYARSSYFIGIDGDEVVIYRGQPDGVLWFDPTVEEPLALSVDDLDPTDLPTINDGVEFDTLEEAQQYAEELRLRADLVEP